MSVGIRSAVGGPAESLLVRAAEQSAGRAAVTRRCADLTELRGAANAKAKRELGWRPAYPSWRQGFEAA